MGTARWEVVTNSSEGRGNHLATTAEERVDTYNILIVWNDEEGGYIATSPEFEDLSAFGATAQVAAAQLESVVLVAIEKYRKSGWTLPGPPRVHEHSGQLRVRLPKSLHGLLAAEVAEVITNGHLVTMSDRVGVAELKARLSEYLRRVRRGETITILDRETEIARILPLAGADPLSVRPPFERVARIQDVPLPPTLELEVDVLELLREERQAER